ncbi:MAG: NAD-dependent epimerase/dehydratase family protein [Nocardioidaceae bacterium]
MRVLVTGAAGFIGSHLSEALVGSGHEVVGLDVFAPFYDGDSKRRNLAALLEHPAFELVERDLLAVSTDGLLQGVDAVAHLAGQPGVTTSWGSDFERYLADNVLATQRLLDAATRCRLQRFVYASSSSVYGPRVAEPALLGLRPASPYGVSKLAAELLVETYARSFGVPGVSLRYFSVYGPRQRPDMAVHRFVEALLDGRPVDIFGDGRQARDFTYVSDVVDATMRALDAELPPGLVVDVAGGTPITVDALVGELREVLGLSAARCQFHDERAGDVQRTEGRPGRALEYLGWSPKTDLRTGLTQQVRWHRALRADGQLSPNAPRGDVVPSTRAGGL